MRRGPARTVVATSSGGDAVSDAVARSGLVTGLRFGGDGRGGGGRGGQREV